MNDELLKEAYKFKETIENDERVTALKKAEKEMENSEEVMRLAYAFSCAQDDYNDTLRHFSMDSKEARDKQHKLYETKLALDSHPLVKEYNKKYKKVRLMYEKIQKEIFTPFNSHNCNEKR